jgi:ubiquinone/menaquinone biosynthesis C-methylase UbiE
MQDERKSTGLKKGGMIVLLITAMTAFLILIWRWLSRNESLPCPPWLIFLLENPYMDTVAGSKIILDRAGLETGMKLLDVGCGPGRLTIPAAVRVGPEGQIVAVDIQPKMIRRLEDRIHGEGLTNTKIVLGGAGDGQIGHNGFDRALLVTVLGEIPDKEAALAEIFQLLKPGGVLSITEVIPDPHYQSQKRVRQLINRAGFKEVQFFGSWVAYTLNVIKPHNLPA